MRSGSCYMLKCLSSDLQYFISVRLREDTILWIASISGYDKETTCSFHNKADDDDWNVRNIYWKPVRYSFMYKISSIYSRSIGYLNWKYGIAVQSSDFNCQYCCDSFLHFSGNEKADSNRNKSYTRRSDKI